ncbi:MAG: hypothetical protein R2813_10830 [Flavobacteriales bacterium]
MKSDRSKSLMEIRANRVLILLTCCACEIAVSGCQKDKLKDELESFKGRYTWIEYRFRQNWWDAFLTTRPASNYDFTAEIEFDKKGKLKFYVDGNQIHETRYSIKEQNLLEDGQTVYLSLRPRSEESDEIDLNNTIDFWLKGDTLTCDDFPGESYDDKLGGEHLFQRN